MIESIEAVVVLLTVVVALLSTVATLVAKLTNNKRVLQVADRLNFYNEQLPLLMAQVERTVGMTGDQKKKWVVSQLQMKARSLGLSIDYEIVEQLVETFIEFSKKVNAKG